MGRRTLVHAVVFLLLLTNQVMMATEKTFCNPGEYEVLGNDSCSRVCPPGYYVSTHIDQDHHIGACSPCPSGTFRAHPSEEPRCVPCAQCREDQEVVKLCSTTSDQECQCQLGQFYCDSEDCTESCFRCTRCGDGATLQPCTATSNAICALNPESGHPGSSWTCLGVSAEVCIPIIVAIVAIVVIVIAAFVVYRRTGHRNKLSGSSPGASQSNDLEMGPLAPAENTSQESVGNSARLTSEGPPGAEPLQVANGSLATPGEPGDQTRMLEAPGPPGQAEPSPSVAG
ncbi:tumor necrosis factor receptor superfamily member 26-like [Ovis aries]|uniref:tumor necrosis factor receptor superfamily member 26-like n=1 Tax=Ovis aries TaxID=9940 RepID=UPI001C2E1D9F|nr:tumor necrosis factor receptor superfamily member 26-like [Ovis aries]